MRRKLLFASLCVLAVAMFIPSSAGAYRYMIDNPGHNSSNTVSAIDPSQSFTVRQTRGGVEQFRTNQPAGAENYYFFREILAGDVIEIYQPQTATPPDSSPVSTFTVPDVTINATAGSPAVTGTAPDGWTAVVTAESPCSGPSPSLSTIAGGGAYSVTFATPAVTGQSFHLSTISPTGDFVGRWENIRSRIPGDAGCVWADATSTAFEERPYHVGVWGLDGTIPSTRLVLRRGGTTIADDNNTQLSLKPDQKPLPGDVIDVYRPEDAGAAAYSWTIPQISGVFDTGNDLAAIDAPAAAEIGVWLCRPLVCSSGGDRGAVDTPAGRSFFDFAKPQGYYRSYDIAPDTVAEGYWYSPNYMQEYDFNLVPGDLTAPGLKISLAKSLKAEKLGKKKLKLKLTSNEAGNATATLALAPAKKGKKAVRLASGKGAVKAGRNTLSLKFSKSGRKALKKLIKGGKSRKATVTVSLTDASGNVTTVVKSTTIKVKKPKKKRR